MSELPTQLNPKPYELKTREFEEFVDHIRSVFPKWGSVICEVDIGLVEEWRKAAHLTNFASLRGEPFIRITNNYNSFLYACRYSDGQLVSKFEDMEGWKKATHQIATLSHHPSGTLKAALIPIKP